MTHEIFIVCDLDDMTDDEGALIPEAGLFITDSKTKGLKLILTAGNITDNDLQVFLISSQISSLFDKIIHYQYKAAPELSARLLQSNKSTHYIEAIDDYRQQLSHRDMPTVSKKKFIFVCANVYEAMEVTRARYNVANNIIRNDSVEKDVRLLSRVLTQVIPCITDQVNAEIERQKAYAELERYETERLDKPERIGNLHRFFAFITLERIQLGFDKWDKIEAVKALMKASNDNEPLPYDLLPALTSGNLGEIAKNPVFTSYIEEAKANKKLSEKSGYQRVQ